MLDTLVCAKGRDQVLGTEALVVLRACCVPLITRCLLLVQFPDFPERQGWAKSGSIGTNQRSYAVSKDGQRFLFNVTPQQGTTAPLTVVLNWLALRK